MVYQNLGDFVAVDPNVRVPAEGIAHITAHPHFKVIIALGVFLELRTHTPEPAQVLLGKLRVNKEPVIGVAQKWLDDDIQLAVVVDGVVGVIAAIHAVDDLIRCGLKLNGNNYRVWTHQNLVAFFVLETAHKLTSSHNIVVGHR